MRLRPAPLRPGDEQVGAPPAQAVLPLDAPAAIDDPLQERLQQELRPRFGVVEAGHPVFGVLAEERLERGQQLVDVEAAVVIHVPGDVLDQLGLDRIGELPRHDLRVDRIGDARRVVAGNQPQVAHVLQVTGGGCGPVAAAQQRLDHAAYARFPELVGELIEVDHPAQDELLLGVEEVVGGSRARPVTAGVVAEAGFATEGVHQPRLAPSLPPHGIQRFRGERLPGLLGVLREQRSHVGLREVAEAQRLGPDVEYAAAGDRRVLGAGMDAVVAHVAHPAQHDALRES